MQATEDIKEANSGMENNHFEWACFQSQQSAEKALKALLMAFNINNQGNGLVHLLKEWNRAVYEKSEENHKNFESKFQELLENCQELDHHFFQPRYPKRFASGYPAEYYNQNSANKSITFAKSIINYVKETLVQITSLDA